MSDNNVLRFRRPEKKPEPKPARSWDMPGWLPWLGLLGLAIAIYLAQRQGLFGG